MPSAQVASSRELNVEVPVSSMGAVVDAGAQQRIVDSEEKIEYRDQDGKLLDEDEVKSLMEGGQASFSTKYETKTLLVDEEGKEVPAESASDLSSTAPAHPDTENVDSETADEAEPQATEEPRTPAEADVAPEEASSETAEVDTAADAAAPASDSEVQQTA